MPFGKNDLNSRFDKKHCFAKISIHRRMASCAYCIFSAQKKRKEEKIDVICIHLLRAKSKKTKACSSLMRFHVLTRCFEVFLNAFSSTRLFKLISGKTWQNMVSYIVFLIRFRYTTHQIRHNHFIFV